MTFGGQEGGARRKESQEGDELPGWPLHGDLVPELSCQLHLSTLQMGEGEIISLSECILVNASASHNGSHCGSNRGGKRHVVGPGG